MIAGSWLQIGSTTSHFCSGEATLLGVRAFKWNISTAGKNPILVLKVREIQIAPASRNEGSFVAWQNGGIAWYFSGAGLFVRNFPQSEASSWCCIHQQPGHGRGISHFFLIKVDSRAHEARKHFGKMQGNRADSPPDNCCRPWGLREGCRHCHAQSKTVRIRGQSLYCSACWKLYPLGSVSLKSHSKIFGEAERSLDLKEQVWIEILNAFNILSPHVKHDLNWDMCCLTQMIAVTVTLTSLAPERSHPSNTSSKQQNTCQLKS